MIPLKIQLKNFLSYGKKLQTISFSSYKLICLSGKNGHGKSALLDAITWVLWGQARKISATSKADPGILRLGEEEVSVSFDFIFNEQTYRVKRDYSKKYGKPHLHIDFGLLDTDNDYYIPLTEKTVRKTQLKIEKTIGLSYESFINSSFLRQGQSNEFSKKSAKERKEILATILGLNHYDTAKSFVLEKIRTMNQEKDHYEKIQQRISQEYDEIKDTPGKLIALDLEIDALSKKENEIQQSFILLTNEQKALAQKKNHQILLKNRLDNLNKDYTFYKDTIYKLFYEWQSEHKRIVKQTDITTLEKEKERLLQEITVCHKEVQEHIKKYALFVSAQEIMFKRKDQLQAPLIAQEQLYILSTQQITFNEQLLIKQQKELYIQQEELVKQQHIIAEKKTTLLKELSPEALITDSTEQQKIFEKNRERYQRWVEQGNWVNTQQKEIVQKQHLSQDELNPSCPLCEQNLSQSRKRFLQQKFVSQAEFLSHRLNRIQQSLGLLKQRLHTQHKELTLTKQLETVIEEEKKIEKQIIELALNKEKNTLELTECLKNKELVIIQKEDIKKQFDTVLTQDTAYQNALKTVLEWNDAESNNNPHATLQKLSEEFEKINLQLQLCQKTAEQKQAQEERQKQISVLRSSIKNIQNEQQSLKATLQEYDDVHTQEELLTQKENAYKQTSTLYREQKNNFLTLKGKLQSEEKKRLELLNEQVGYTAKTQNLITQIHEHTIIAQAFGKDGVQALLIEEILPEIEYEANQLLARLTDNQASIQIESLKDLKKGGTRETLDINISDTNGIRPYEMFSGGEAFRIDFALRIALSKLLARRAGTSLQTLIIDEGFGSQDDEGLSRIMDALYAIQDDFEKIIIVSHLTTMKDQFPVHFYVEKSAQGSNVTVFEQG